MTIWKPALDSRTHPVYMALADALARDVAEGTLEAGVRLPTHRDLARDLGINVGTVTRAYAEAARRGLVQGEVGRGTFVRGRRISMAGVVPAASLGATEIDLAFNIPIDDAATSAVPGVLEEIAREADPAALFEGYRIPGLDAHRAAGVEWMARTKLDGDPDRTLVVGGAQHGMAVAFAALVESGDVVLVEEATYAGIKSLAGALGLRLEPVRCDADGLEPEALENACRRLGPKVLYTMPNLQNPTGIVMPEPRRRELASIVRAHGVRVVEDDTYGVLCDEVPPPLAAYVPELVTFVTSTSKGVAAGLRTGWLHAPEGAHASGLFDRLLATVAGLTWMSAPLTAEIATRWIHDGTVDRVIEHKRAECRARREMYDGILGASGTLSQRSSPHVWLALPDRWRGDVFASEARRRGVAVAPPELFAPGRAAPQHAVRLSLGTPRTREQLERGLTALAELLAERPESAVQPGTAIV